MRKQLDVVDELFTSLQTTLDTEADDGSFTFRQILPGIGMILVVGKTLGQLTQDTSGFSPAMLLQHVRFQHDAACGRAGFQCPAAAGRH